MLPELLVLVLLLVLPLTLRRIPEATGRCVVVLPMCCQAGRGGGRGGAGQGGGGVRMKELDWWKGRGYNYTSLLLVYLTHSSMYKTNGGAYQRDSMAL